MREGGGKHPDAVSYARMRGIIADGDVLLYEGSTFYSRIVKKVTRSRFSHAGITVWWNERLMVMEAVGRGVVVTPLSLNVGHYHGHVHWFTAKENLSRDQRRRMIIYAQGELGKEYALWNAIWVGIKLLFNWRPEQRDRLRRQRKFFCSSYVAQIYNAVGIDLKPGLSDDHMVPEDIASSAALEPRGVLKNLRD